LGNLGGGNQGYGGQGGGQGFDGLGLGGGGGDQGLGGIITFFFFCL
jgi:hypothetical protein